jgi:hypothetical protein
LIVNNAMRQTQPEANAMRLIIDFDVTWRREWFATGLAI